MRNKGMLPLALMLTVLGSLIVASMPAFGDVIYDNGGPTSANVPSNVGNIPGVPMELVLADNFSFSDNVSLQDVHWWGSYLLAGGAPATDNFRIQLFNDSGLGTPSLNPFYSVDLTGVSRVDTGMTDAVGNAIYEYSVVLPAALNLSSGSTYYLSIAGNTAQNWAWAGSASLSNFGYYLRNSDSDPWAVTVVPPNLAFNLTGVVGDPVPEPASLALFGIGLGGMAFGRFWRRGHLH